jgi:hypothetical protein
VATLRDEQNRDETLRSGFALAKQSKGGFFCRDGLLYRHEKIVNQTYERLVLPVSQRGKF